MLLHRLRGICAPARAVGGVSVVIAASFHRSDRIGLVFGWSGEVGGGGRDGGRKEGEKGRGVLVLVWGRVGWWEGGDWV